MSHIVRDPHKHGVKGQTQNFIKMKMFIDIVCDSHKRCVWPLFINIVCDPHEGVILCMNLISDSYGVAVTSRIDQIIGLFRKRALSKSLYSVQETYNVKL